MGFSTSAAFIILVTAGITAGLGLLSILNAYSDNVESAAEEQRDRMADEIHTDIVILNYSTPRNVLYNFSNSGLWRFDRWAAEKDDESADPPSTGPFISGESDFTNGMYGNIEESDSSRASTVITNSRYATHHFLFTISEDPATIFNLSVVWEGFGTRYPSYVYIWNYAASAWELIGIGTSTSSDNVVAKDLTVNSATPANYIDSRGYLHLIATSYRFGGGTQLHSDYVRIFISTGGLWVKNTGETTLDPAYAVLFDNYEYVEPAFYPLNVDGGYWDPGEILRISYNSSMAVSHLLKVTTGKGVSDSYYYAP